jgi:hypothetical protein
VLYTTPYRHADKNEIRRQECGRNALSSLSINNGGSARGERKISVRVLRVEHGVTTFGGGHHERILEWLHRGSRFLPLRRCLSASEPAEPAETKTTDFFR